jgi:hypothetical protein
MSNRVIRVKLKETPEIRAELEEHFRWADEWAKLPEKERVAQFRPMTSAERAEHMRRTGIGRPRKKPSERAARVLFTIDPKLLKSVDKFARKKGITRAQMIADGLRLLMKKAG